MISFTPKAEREMKELFALRREAVELLRAVIMEWESDPMSVQCFDERLRTRAQNEVGLAKGAPHTYKLMKGLSRSRLLNRIEAQDG